MSDEELTKLFEGYGWHPMIVQGADLDGELAGALDTAYGEIRDLQGEARNGKRPERPRWPMLIVQVAQGLDRAEGGRRHPGRGHVEGPPGARDEGQVRPRAPQDPRGVAALLQAGGAVRRQRRADGGDPGLLPAPGDLRMGANPHVNGGKMRKDLKLPELGKHALEVAEPGRGDRQRARPAGRVLRGRLPAERRRGQLPHRLPRRGGVQPARRGVRGHRPRLGVAARSRRSTRGTPPTGASWRCSRSTTARAGCRATCSPAATACSPATRRSSRSSTGWSTSTRSSSRCPRTRPPGASRWAALNYLLTSVGWRQDHNGYSHQMPGFINSMLNRKEDTARVYLPPDANTLLATFEQVLQVHADDQPRDRLEAPAAAVAHDRRGTRARGEGSEHVRVGQQPARRPGHRARGLRHDPDDRAAGRHGAAARARPGAEGALRVRHRPVHAWRGPRRTRTGCPRATSTRCSPTTSP